MSMPKSRTAPTSRPVLFLLPLLIRPASRPAVGQGLRPGAAHRRLVRGSPAGPGQVQLACIDDPGHLARDPDCVNAHQASVEAALREARTRTGNPLDPSDPAFWIDDPETRRSKLIMCRRNPELANCDAAKRSLMVEAGVAQR